MSGLQILVPMGGLGSRFADKGYTTPKPLIEVEGKPMFMRALDSFSAAPDAEHLIVIRRDHEEKYNLSKSLLEQLPDAKITILEHDTRGPVETCLLAIDDIDDDLPIIVADCDIYFESKAYFEKVKNAQTSGKPDGMLLTFPASDARYSYVEIDDSGKAVRTAEKEVISNHAILGGYFFSSGRLFKDLAQDFLSKGLPENLKEYYMSHLFNILLERGGSIEIADIDIMHIFGTPEELEAYQSKKMVA